MGERIGFTTTIPVEAILAAGAVPVDLNNGFITAADREHLLEEAEHRGIPASTCAWIKGLYSAIRRGVVDRVIVVLEGDCSNTHALAELLEHDGVVPIPFRFPYDRDPKRLARELSALCEALGTSIEAAEELRTDLLPLRQSLAELDRAAWEHGRLPFSVVRDLQLASSDFHSDLGLFRAEVSRAWERAEATSVPAPGASPRLALAGVPTAYDDLVQNIEAGGGQLVLDEMPRQFSMPCTSASSLLEQYLAYTYPYDAAHRLDDLGAQLRTRRVQGVVHYVQAFCHRQIEDVVLRERLGVPVLTLEGDRPGPLDERSRVRLQAFLEVLGGSGRCAASTMRSST